MDQDPEKKPFTAITTDITGESGPLLEDAGRRRKSVKHTVYTITFFAALPCIPVIVISFVLLYYIFHHRVVLQPGWPELTLNTSHRSISNLSSVVAEIRHQGGKPAYFVAYNPSTITTIAAWTGRVIPYLSSSIMALVAFFAARHLVYKSKRSTGSDLPTPEQLTLLIGLLNGNSFSPLWDTLIFRYGRKERQRLVAPIPAAFAALSLITLTGIFIPIIDTWFGVSVEPVVISQTVRNLLPGHSYGRELNTTFCPFGPGSTDYDGIHSWANFNPDTEGQVWIGCNLLWALDAEAIFVGGYDAAKVLAGLSTTDKVLNITSDVPKPFYFLQDVNANQSLDFKAQSLAVSTQCVPMTTKCYSRNNIDSAGDIELAFQCTPGFKGDLSLTGAGLTDPNKGIYQQQASFGIAFASDALFSTMIGSDPNSDEFILPQNPLYFAAWAVDYPIIDSTDVPSALANSDEIVRVGTIGGTAWVLNCSSTVYEIDYSWINGAVYNYTLTPASAAMAGMVSGPFANYLSVPYNSQVDNAQAAGFSDTMDQLCTTFANGFSKAAVAMTVGVMMPMLNDIEQYRENSISVARVPMIPLYLLLSLKAIYVLAIVILAIGAYCFAHPAEMGIVKDHLSVKGLVAAHFNQPALLQSTVVTSVKGHLEKTEPAKASEAPPSSPATEKPQEPPKVGIFPAADGTWKFMTLVDGVWKSIQPLISSVILPDAKAGELGGVGDVYAAWK